jgi:hypothetical protein
MVAIAMVSIVHARADTTKMVFLRFRAIPSERITVRASLGDQLLLSTLDHNSAGRREFVISSTKRILAHLGLFHIAPDRENAIAFWNTSGRADGFAKRLSHSVGNPIRTRPGGLFVLAEHVVGELP